MLLICTGELTPETKLLSHQILQIPYIRSLVIPNLLGPMSCKEKVYVEVQKCSRCIEK